MVYIDGIAITTNDIPRIAQLRHLKYFIGIEVTQSKECVIVSQRKYVLDILEETCLTNCKHVDSPMHSNQKLMSDQGELFSNLERYKRSVEKLIYVTITRPDLDLTND